jgi:hypothetical protein
MLFDGLSNEQAIVLVLAGFYLYESIAWVPAGALAFMSRGGQRYVVAGNRGFDIGDKGSLFIGSLWPTANTVVAESWPLKFSPNGIVVESTAGLGGKFYSYALVRELRADNAELLLAGKRLCKFTSPLAATSAAQLISQLAIAEEPDRDALLLRWIDSFTNEERVRGRHGLFNGATRLLRPLNALFFGLTFAVGIVVGWSEWAWIQTPTNALLTFFVWLAMWLAIIYGFCRAQRTIYPDDRRFRRQRLIAFVISPACAMRAVDLLSRDLLAESHPLAAAKQLCSTATFRALARRRLLEFIYPLAADYAEPAEVLETRQWFDERMQDALTSLVQRSGESLEQLLAAPVPLSDDALSYCPRCEMQYAIAEGECRSCAGVPLRMFEQAIA